MAEQPTQEQDVISASLEKLAEAVPQVAESFEESEAARAAELDAEAAVLAKAIEIARPALRAICGKVRLTESTRWIDNAYTDDTHTLSQWRAAILLGDGPTRDHPRANDGSIEGWCLVLRDDGQLLDIEYGGSWTKWQGRSSGWETTVKEITPRKAVEEHRLGDVLAALAQSIGAHGTEKRKEATRASIARAEKLNAMLALVK